MDLSLDDFITSESEDDFFHAANRTHLMLEPLSAANVSTPSPPARSRTTLKPSGSDGMLSRLGSEGGSSRASLGSVLASDQT